jgi:regulator of sirC expression with transglutaminase-like and TPR domain
MDATRRFVELLGLPDPELPLDEAALVIAAHAEPGLDVATELARVDDLAAGVRDPTLTGVLRHLYRDLGFTGNRDDYYDPANSMLHHVMRRRVGIPITLSVLTMEVGRRIGVPLWGVGMPGHFLLRDKVDPAVFVDPFDAGRVLDERGCARLFRQVHGSAAQLDPVFLQPVARHQIVARILVNLRGVYAARGDRSSLLWVLALRAHLPGAGPAELGELANVLAADGRLTAAAEAQERAAEMLEVAGADASGARAAAVHLRARLN